MARLLAFLGALLASGSALAADPAVAPRLASPPVLRAPPQVEVPPGTTFPAPEVTVVLEIDVSAAGAVEEVRVVGGAGEPFDAAAVAAARRFEFEPARLEDGAPVPVTITFRLQITSPPPPAPEAPPVRFSGRLVERGTRRPLAGVAVEARGGDRSLASATTDASGRFALEVPAAAFTLLAVPPAHERLEAKVDARPGEERDEIFYLTARPSEYGTVVRGERVRSEVTRQVIPADEVARVPGSQGDTLKAVLNLPGAGRPAFGGGSLILRGSSPGDSAVFVEGLQIPQLYHFGGLRSTFAPRFLEAVEFVPGNFSADYGRLIGGIVNVRVRDPSADLVRGEVDLNLYDLALALEGPASSTWSVGGAFRRSWVDAILPLFVPSDSNVTFSTAPRFYDYQFLATWKPEPRDAVRFLFFGSQDKLAGIIKRPQGDPTTAGDLFARIAFHELRATWAHVYSPIFRDETWVALGLQDVDTQVGPQTFFKLATKRVDARRTSTLQPARWIELRTGLDVQYAHYDVSLDTPQPPKEGEPPAPIATRPRVGTTQAGDLFNPGAFVELGLVPVERLSIVPALRVDWTSAIRRWSLDPRLAVRWGVLPATVVKAAIGVYQQPPSADESSSATGTPDLLPKRSVQYSAGFEQRLGAAVDLDVTGFYKDLTQLVVRDPLAAYDPAAPRYTNDATGRIYGVEALLRARLGNRFFGWIAYTFQRSFRRDHPGAPERRSDYDQPHLLTALGSWQIDPRWAVGARFRLVSGYPYTPVNGSVYDAATDVFVPIYGPVNSGRLAPFNALDLRVDRIWTFQRWRLSAYLDVQNVYNRGNQEGWAYRFDYREREPLTGLPILPILGVKGEW